ncbi:MAG: TRAP transporter substrate-binding protein [Pseudotabrizicola sp.]|uniref:TRAP transporter substrate-binding protein n=1 Tax=Pseudotabrizicola sp. TaxID=2939647 RepID=UPI00271DE6E9|nr:TRAP transporter substrate-binding protein [Pseudotabrizicola sp.]MDO9639103.1 TRAP transporter substrate-binding protein [Pseudotabrizicola sp.]
MNYHKSLIAAGVALAICTAGAQAQTFRFAAEAPAADSQVKAAEHMNELLAEKSGGDLALRIFPGGTLGNAQAVITGTRGNTVDMFVTGTSNISGLKPEMGMLDIPFLFQDSDHAYRVLDGEVGRELLDQLDDVGLKGLAFWENGWRQITTKDRIVSTPADLAGMKIRTTGAPVHIRAFELLGSNPVPMPIGELYTALEMGTVTAQEHPLGVFMSSKFYEVQDNITLSRHAYSPLVVAMSKTKFDALSPEHQQMLLDAAVETAAFQRQLNSDALAGQVEELRAMGKTVSEDFVQEPFVAATAPVREGFIAEFGGAEKLEAIDALRD